MQPLSTIIYIEKNKEFIKEEIGKIKILLLHSLLNIFFTIKVNRGYIAVPALRPCKQF